MSFDSLGLCTELLKVVAEQGYNKPSPIQIEAIPAVLSGRDVMAVGQTGTGKTAAFTLPILQLLAAGSPLQALSVRALIITPTRELAAQIAASVKKYKGHSNICSAAVFGGVRIEPQIIQLETGIDILVATPGRLIDLYNQQAINFEQLEVVVFDEADRMLDLGFIDEISHIQSLLPNKRQSLMFSATFSQQIKSLAKGMLNNPLLIEVTAANSVVESIQQKLHPVDKSRKSELLIYLIKKHKWPQVLVFSRTKHGANDLVSQLKNFGINADSIHANRTQHARTIALDGFKNANIQVLVATDIASRGIDVNQLACVVNFDLPYVPEDYVHRIGRTGRVGSLGLAVSFYSEDESKQLQAIERLIGHKLARENISSFMPTKKKAPVASVKEDDDDLYGNFEAAPKPSDKSKGRGNNGANSSKRKRRNN
ncbi:DEAD/DEAH box helicase [Paraglaciecola sp. L3A3]|uniref:DEAD/DEAH box helicase n=1 Tax=Paraglaciecola sp. L3A3 TaxID=2686358 RepID=UPI00131E9766|nr:DEAD/DEAH box helicase [Paraglaciecola sp. L3A3]